MLNIKQRQLNLYHYYYYYTGKIDGVEGTLTKAAYGKFQKDSGLAVDRIYGPKTETKLMEAAKNLQTRLNECGAKLAVDGLIGNKTVAAIKAFQKANNLIPDGIAGIKTMTKLNKAQTGGWDGIKYFKRSEFKCDCGGKYCDGYPVEPNMELVKMLDELREYFAVPVTVTSGIRCLRRNTEVGGIATSAHLKGKAADVYVPGADCEKVKQRAYHMGAAYSYYGTPGMGNAVHINI